MAYRIDLPHYTSRNSGRNLQTTARPKISMGLLIDLIASVNYYIEDLAAGRVSLLTRQLSHNCAAISAMMRTLTELNWN